MRISYMNIARQIVFHGKEKGRSLEECLDIVCWYSLTDWEDEQISLLVTKIYKGELK